MGRNGDPGEHAYANVLQTECSGVELIAGSANFELVGAAVGGVPERLMASHFKEQAMGCVHAQRYFETGA